MTAKQGSNPLCERLSGFSRLAGAVVIGIGVSVLAGWWAQVDAIKRVFPGMISMNPLTAFCFVSAGAAVFLQASRTKGGKERIVRLLGGVILLVGMAKLGYLLAGRAFPADQWLFADQLGRGEPGTGNQMAPNTALCFGLLGAALLLVDRTTKQGIRPSEVLAVIAGMLGLLALVGYVYRIVWLYGGVVHLPMALNTAVTFLLVSSGVICARSDRGLMAVVTGDSSGGLLARRMFPAVVLAFLLAGSMKLMGERRGYFDSGLGTALFTVTSIGIFGVFVLWSARSLHQGDLDRQRIEEERERFFRISPDLLGIAGMDGYFKRVNPAFTTTLGYSAEEMTSRPFLEFIHPDDVAATLAEMESLGTGAASLRFENRYRCKDDSWKWLSWNTQPYSDEGLLYAVARDVTGQKQTELEMRLQTARLEAANQELESFCYSVSHDLRAPLRGISGFSQALEEHAADTLDTKGQGYLLRIRAAAERMGLLIDDLLKLSRLTRAEMRMENVDLSALAGGLIAEYRAADPSREAETVIARDVLVRGDPALLEVMLDNLLGNSWKFTGNNPAARIEFGSRPAPSGQVVCFVKDNGVGFDNRYAHKLFGAFQRLHSQVEFPGTGIGLATVHRIVRRHGGEVRAEGEINHGAIFEITLEAGPAHE